MVDALEVSGDKRTITLDYTSGCSFLGGFWALSPIENLAQWPPMPGAPS